ncbi:MAG: porin [Candidatus Marinimicrobia bacterium]|nr:porin [Candidatus Neomarinimicrobiota bacterium]
MKKLTLMVLSLALTSILVAKDTKIGGDTYFHYTYEDADNSSFNLSRAYFTFSKEVNDQVSYKFQTDIGGGGPSDYTVYLKNANLSYKSDFGKLVFGLQGMNMFKIQEDTWGYRFIEKSAMDMYKYSSSADMGISWEKSLGAITPSVMISNGTGYKKDEDDAYKKLSVRVLYGKATLKQGFNAGAVVSMEAKDYDDGTGNMEKGGTTVFGAFAAGVFGPIKVGGEYATLSKDMGSAVTGNVLSVYGNFNINKMISGFGRFDLVDPDADTENNGYNYLIIGADYHPGKVFHMAPNVKIKSPETGDSESIYQVSFRFKI